MSKEKLDIFKTPNPVPSFYAITDTTIRRYPGNPIGNNHSIGQSGERSPNKGKKSALARKSAISRFDFKYGFAHSI